MARKKFSDQEVETLKNNPYTLHVNTDSIRFSEEFKDKFYALLQEEKSAEDILQQLGYDPKMLGKERIKYMQKSITESRITPLEELYKKMEQMQYEIDVLKKIIILNNKRR
jgi:transposase-like protein